MSAIRMAGYNRETAIAEKLEAMIKLGDMKSRKKDHYDVWALAAATEFDGAALGETVCATVVQRETRLAVDPVCLSRSFVDSPAKQSQWNAFLWRIRDPNAPAQFADIIHRLWIFLPVLPVGQAHWPHWSAGGPCGDQRHSNQSERDRDPVERPHIRSRLLAIPGSKYAGSNRPSRACVDHSTRCWCSSSVGSAMTRRNS